MAELYRTLSRELHEIRLLVIEPGSGNDPVRCRMRHINLRTEPAPPYDTVSYVWGDPRIRATILVGGESVDVPVSSERVLRRFRQPHFQRTIWLDAVCINQEDRIERGDQVGVMHQIYGNARCNLIWLGDDDGLTERALYSIESIFNEISRETDDFEKFFDMLYQENGVEIYNSDTAITADVDWESLLAFFASPWFRRLWVVQEASLARHNICYRGSLKIPLDHVLKVAQWLRYKRFHLPFEIGTRPGMHHSSFIAQFMERPAHKGQRIGFCTLLGWLRPFQASEPKDYVYAVFGLFIKIRNEEVPESLKPDYTSPLAATYTAAARYDIADRDTMSLEVVRYVFNREYDDNSEDPKMPSWVPRWNWQWDGKWDANDLGLLFRACGNKNKWSCEVDTEHPDVLTVKGVLVGKANMVLDLATRKVLGDPSQLLALFERARSTVNDSTPTSQPEEKLITSAIALVAGRDWNRIPYSPASDAAEEFSAFESYLTTKATLPPSMSSSNESTPEQDKLASRYHQALIVGLENKHFFSTSTGLIGNGPPTMRNGDIVAVLHGLQVPAVLRPLGQNRFQYVGECFLHGIMFGEAFAQDDREHEIFELQ